MELGGYTLEAQRLAVLVPLIRQIPNDVPEPPKISLSDGKEPTTVVKGAVLLVEFPPFSSQIIPCLLARRELITIVRSTINPTHFANPATFDPNRLSSEYLPYGRAPNTPFTAKHITIIAITGLIKGVAKLGYLRRAHNTEGRLSTAKTPDEAKRYLT
ncbi:MAG: hypothetical protein MMC33_002454 [Icmadophila ericetorum]|nr:hypothetical protein [Icmadophila ericetorum]